MSQEQSAEKDARTEVDMTAVAFRVLPPAQGQEATS